MIFQSSCEFHIFNSHCLLPSNSHSHETILTSQCNHESYLVGNCKWLTIIAHYGRIWYCKHNPCGEEHKRALQSLWDSCCSNVSGFHANVLANPKFIFNFVRICLSAYSILHDLGTQIIRPDELNITSGKYWTEWNLKFLRAALYVA